MDDLDLAELRNKCLTNLYSCTYNISKYNQSGKEDRFNKLRDYVKEYCLLEMRQKTLEQLIESFEESEDADESLLTRSQEQYMAQCLQAESAIRLNRHPYIMELEKNIKEAERQNKSMAHGEEMVISGDSELAITEIQSAYIDPLGLKPIRNPMRNRICNHVYEKDTMENYIKTKNKGCPYVGCSNKKQIRNQDLVFDMELKQTLPSTSNASENISQVSNVSTEY